jgi:hypothetical protein
VRSAGPSHKGASELELVTAALEDTMVDAYRDISDIYLQNRSIETLRTAAFCKSDQPDRCHLPEHEYFPIMLNLIKCPFQIELKCSYPETDKKLNLRNYALKADLTNNTGFGIAIAIQVPEQ